VEFIAWVAEFSKEINSYLEVNSNLTGTDALQHIHPIIDKLLWWKYMYEKAAYAENQMALMQLGLPGLTSSMQGILDKISVDELPDDKDVAFNGDMTTGDLS
jgi:hypothetical protein